MDDGYSIPFSSLLAGLLMFRQTVKPLDVVKVIADLQINNISVDDMDDDIDFLSFCIDVSRDYSFSLKKDISYHTILDNGNTLYQFLEEVAGEVLIQFFMNNCKYSNEFFFIYEREHIFENSLSFVKKNNKRISLKKRKTSWLVIPSFIRGIH